MLQRLFVEHHNMLLSISEPIGVVGTVPIYSLPHTSLSLVIQGMYSGITLAEALVPYGCPIVYIEILHRINVMK